MQYVDVCAKHETYGNEVCSSKARIHEKDLLENVVRQLKTYVSKALNETALSQSKAFQAQKEKLLRKISKSDESIKEINDHKFTIFEAYVNGNSSAYEFKTNLCELNDTQKHQEADHRCA